MNKRFFLICTAASLIRLVHTLMLEEYFEEASNLIAFVHQKLLRKEIEQGWTEVLLPTGAKVQRNIANTKKGSFIISGYAHNSSDLFPYLSYGKKAEY
jgi:hypothetical protein